MCSSDLIALTVGTVDPTGSDRDGTVKLSSVGTLDAQQHIAFYTTQNAFNKWAIIRGDTSQADIGEWITANEVVEGGDILTIDAISDKDIAEYKADQYPAAAKRTRLPYDKAMIGVVPSNEPAKIFGDSQTDHDTLISLGGRMPVKVATVNGDIQPGDFITSSDIPGVGMKAAKPGVVIGRALTSLYSGPAIKVNSVEEIKWKKYPLEEKRSWKDIYEEVYELPDGTRIGKVLIQQSIMWVDLREE